MNHLLTLVYHYDREKGLDKYNLFYSDNGRYRERWVVTSSHRLGQQKGDQHSTGGLLPSMLDVSFSNYFVKLAPWDSRHVRGVDGNFYQITPWDFKTKQGTRRAHFGIHLDINNNGTMGCIGMSRSEFAKFEKKAAQLRRGGLNKVPLLVFAS